MHANRVPEGGDTHEEFPSTVVEEFPAFSTQKISLGEPVELESLEAMPTLAHVGRYALKHRLGQGGLGTVHAAVDPLLGRQIAVKTLHLEGAGAAERSQLEAVLLNEARAAAGLKHPHIVAVYDAGLSEHGIYITMERLHGRDLRLLLTDGWRPEPLKAAQIVRRVADALSYAHSKGVVHCDIKPGNIFMVGRTQPTVLDFGIARVTRRSGSAADAGRSIFEGLDAGSPMYMAPEQLNGAPVDARCDVYSLGVVLYELLTGRRAFEGRSLDEIRDAVMHADVPPAHLVAPHVPAALSAIAQRAMERDPDKRYRSARQFSRALRQLLGEAAAAESRMVDRRTLWLIAGAAGLLLAGGWFWHQAQMRQVEELAATPAVVESVVAAAAEAAEAASAAQASLVADALANAAPADAASAPLSEAVLVAASPAEPAASAAAPPPAAAKPVRKAAPKPKPVAAAAEPVVVHEGTLNIAISPWGTVEVNGKPVGTAPPVSHLTLPEGSHHIVVRNEDFPPYSTTVTVSRDKPVTIKHRFGS